MITEKEIKDYAISCADMIVIRSYDENGSYDERRYSTQEEADILSKLIAGALLAVRMDFSKYQLAADTAEYIAILLFDKNERGGVNCYDSVYSPIVRFCREKRGEKNAM